MSQPATCWVMSEDAAGMISQALGLAEALGYEDPPVKKIALQWPWTWMPNWRTLASLGALASSARLEPPWPDLLMTCGRKAAFISLALGKLHPGMRRIHIQNPRQGLGNYDLLLVPKHDGIQGSKVMVTNGAVHRVNARRLEDGRKEFADYFSGLARPLVSVLLGGTNRSYRLDAEWAAGFGRRLQEMQNKNGAGLAITPSRRTDPAAVVALQRVLGDRALIWNGQGANPYFGMLASADALVVTCDSISMISEACSTGKPVLLERLPGSSDRFEGFFAELEKSRLIRWFDGQLVTWDNGRLDDMDRIAREVKERLGWAS